MPDSIVVAAIASSPDNAVRNNVLILDDIAATLIASPPIQNGDFETWIDTEGNELIGWLYPRHIKIGNVVPVFVNQAIFSAPGDYAAELQNVSFGGGRWSGTEIGTKPLSFDKAPGGFPVYARHQTLNGYFKWLPENGDTMLIDVSLRTNGQPIGYGQFTAATAVPDYTTFDIPISYTAAGTPDTAEILIRSFSKNPAKGNSHLFVDKLSFDGFVGIGNDNIMKGQSPESFTLYPNPASTDVVIQLNKEIKGSLKVYDLNGKVIYARDFTGNKVSVDTREFTRGFYIVSVEEGGKRMTNRFIVVK